MMTRRSLVRQGLMASAGMLVAGTVGSNFSSIAFAKEDQLWQMPDEGAPHSATWMLFGASEDIWEPHL